MSAVSDFELVQMPQPGRGRLLYAGEILHVGVRALGAGDAPIELPPGARAFVRTDLNSAPEKRRHVIERVERGVPRIVRGWRDIELTRSAPDTFASELIAHRPGYYELKCYLVIDGVEHWVGGLNSYASVHGLKWRGANTIYTAFPRQFGPTKKLREARELLENDQVLALERQGFTVIPPSGTLTDLARELPFLFHELGVRILHLLPVQETPTVYARMGRYGSPYAATDLTSVGHAYLEFRVDRTPAEQFQELCARVHALGGEVMLDIAANHLGWATELLNAHPEWFVRHADGRFHSPGAWGVTWADLVELDDRNPSLWRHLAESLLTWCARGVDAFRCDAGYMLPAELWEYVTARVHEVFPSTLFLLEGLGGPWDATESILKMGGMQWAYSEIFQQHGDEMLHGYLRHLDHTGAELGILANYAETHDNPRLAAGGESYARMRVALAALTSQAGAFGFTNGVEWLATERVNVHGSSGLNWGATPNLVGWLRQLSDLTRQHPVFWGTSRILPIEGMESGILAFFRQRDREKVLILINLDGRTHRNSIRFPANVAIPGGHRTCILTRRMLDPSTTFSLNPFEVVCLDLERTQPLESGEAVARARQHDEEERRLRWILGELWGERVELSGFELLTDAVRRDGLRGLLAAVSLGVPSDCSELARRVLEASDGDRFLGVSHWTAARADRFHVLGANQFLYIEEDVPFRVRLRFADSSAELETFRDFGDRRYVAFALVPEGEFRIEHSRLDRPAAAGATDGDEPKWIATQGHALSLRAEPSAVRLRFEREAIDPSHRFLLTNARGSYTLLPLAPRTIWSKYDALLAANLHPSGPDERVVVAKRLRAWVATPMVSYPLDREYLTEFQRWPTPTWSYRFELPDGTVHVEERVTLDADQNVVTVELRWESERSDTLALIVRPDLEFRGHHGETKAHGIDQAAFAAGYRALAATEGCGFRRDLGHGLELCAVASAGVFHVEDEWIYNVQHPFEATRGQEAAGDTLSPGYFRVALTPGRGATSLALSVAEVSIGRYRTTPAPVPAATHRDACPEELGDVLRAAAGQFLAKRSGRHTVMAGYPWFLDWSRDALIAARGYLAIGRVDEACEVALTFAAREREGTLPNSLVGDGDANRDTSDGPLWLTRVIEELAQTIGWPALAARASLAGVELKNVLASICDHYLHGTSNGIRCDAASGLVWSPAHFSWMDTNHPAATPREGYPIEIQALWVRALELAARILDRPALGELAARARTSIRERFWIDDLGWFADCLTAHAGTPAANGVRDESLRPNQLWLVALGLAQPEHAQRAVIATHRELVVPGGLRSVANVRLRSWPWLPDTVPPPGLDVLHPYRGQYVGDEDASRKLAYHNGTAWTHLLPLWCEALLTAFPDEPRAVHLAHATMRTIENELQRGCVGQISEIEDGDYPHTPRGTCAQAWSVTEFLRVLAKLDGD